MQIKTKKKIKIKKRIKTKKKIKIKKRIKTKKRIKIKKKIKTKTKIKIKKRIMIILSRKILMQKSWMRTTGNQWQIFSLKTIR